MILTLVGVSNGTLHEMARRAKGIGADIVVRPPGTSIISLSAAPMPDKLLGFFEKQPHVVMATGTIVNPLGGFDTLTGLDFEQFNRMSGGFTFIAGGPFKDRLDLIIDEFYANQKKLTVGSTVELMSQNWRVVGIVEPGKLGRIFCKLTTLQELTSNSNKLSQIFLKVDDEKQAQSVVDNLRLQMPKYFIYTMEEFTSLISISKVEHAARVHLRRDRHRRNRRFHCGIHGNVHRCFGTHSRDRDFESAGCVAANGPQHSGTRNDSDITTRTDRRNPDELRNALYHRHGDSFDAGTGDCSRLVGDLWSDRNRGRIAGRYLSRLESSTSGCYRGAEL